MFDFLVLLVLGLSVLFAVMRGGLRELATIIALAAAGFIALLLVEPILGALGQTDSFFATIFVAVGVVALFFIAFQLLAHFGLMRVPLEGRAGLADKIGGGVFGFARGLVLIGLGFLAYGYYQGEARQPDSVKNAMTRPLASGMANWFLSFTPDDAFIEDEVLRGGVEEESSTVGYDRADREGLEEVITTVTTTEVTADDPLADIIAEEDGQ